ncbi:MAG: adenosylcobalamin-dependent ribonucleoside-diphosphate reductase [Candidatus Paceibacterota bacterium]
MTKLNQAAIDVLKRDYLHGDETPEDMFRRVARTAAIPNFVDGVLKRCRKSPASENADDLIETLSRVGFQLKNGAEIYKLVMKRRGVDYHKYTSFLRNRKMFEELLNTFNEQVDMYYALMSELTFMPATPTLINADYNGMLSSCFFMRIEDSIEDIFEKIKKAAIILKCGGGVGFDMSLIRPAGSVVSSSGGKATGVVSYMKIINAMGEQINQAGIRKAAMMAILDVSHPDICDFIRCKKVEGDLSNFNVSVMINNKYMSRLINNKESPVILKFADQQYYIIMKGIGKSAEYIKVPINDVDTIDTDDRKCLKYGDLWKMIVESAWDNGEPGIIFEDQLEKSDVFDGKYGKLGVNPCGEIPLLSFASCNLASINLNSTRFGSDGVFDYEEFKKVVWVGVRFLDNVIDVNKYPLPEIEEVTLRGRQIGLGVMGLHDLMLRLGIKYGSEKSLELVSNIYKVMQEASLCTSEKLYEQRGAPTELIEALSSKGVKLRRNSNLLSVQPTGSTAWICNQASSSIEPVFKFLYIRRDSHGEHEVKHHIVRDDGKLPEFAVTALDITAKEHVDVQAEVNKYVDNSVSKTINMQETSSVEDVSEALIYAFKRGCRSVTVYRSGSRKNEVLINGSKKEDKETKVIHKDRDPRKRPRVLFGATFSVNTPSGRCFITINEDKHGVREMFAHSHKAGSEIATHLEAEGRMFSNSMKHWVPLESVIEHLLDNKSTPVFDNGRFIKSIPDAMAKTVKEYQDQFLGFSEYLEASGEIPNIYSEKMQQPPGSDFNGEICPECGDTLYAVSGCEECKSCGYSRCG